MTARDKIIQELVESHNKGFLHVERPNRTIEIFADPKAEIEGEWLNACSHSDPDIQVTEWLYSHMDNPPPQVMKIRR